MTIDLKSFDAGMQKIFPATDDAAQQLMDTLHRRHRRRKTINRIVNAAVFGPLLLFVSWIAAQAIDRVPPTRVRDALQSDKVVAGGFLIDEITILEKSRSCDLKISWLIFDGDNEIHSYQLDPLPASGRVEVDKPFTRRFPVPATLAPGPSRFRITRSFACPNNYLHKLNPIVVSTSDMPFEILPKGSK